MYGTIVYGAITQFISCNKPRHMNSHFVFPMGCLNGTPLQKWGPLQLNVKGQDIDVIIRVAHLIRVIVNCMLQSP